MRYAQRIAVLVLGLIGTLDGAIVNAVVSAVHRVDQVLGGSGDPTHGVIGFIICFAFLVGAFLALRYPLPAGILLIVAGIAFFFIVHAWALLASPVIFVAGWLAIMDSREYIGGRRETETSHGQHTPAATA